MRYLNKILLFKFLLLINIICVICPTVEDLQRCKNELYREFKNDEPLDDLLHGLFYIEYDNVNWNPETDTNENYFRGNNGILKTLARTYYYDLYNTAQEMGVPELLTPAQFCSEKHVDEENECISAIVEIGCGPNQHGPDCFEKMYFHWRKKGLNVSTEPGTKSLSDDELLDAIRKGSSEFRKLPEEHLLEAFEAHPDIIYELSDKNLLQNHFRYCYEERPNRYNRRESSRIRRGDYTNDNDFYGDRAYENYLKMNDVDEDVHRDDEFGIYSKKHFNDISLFRARQIAYGIFDLPYEALIAEYKRRKTTYYDNLYAEHICEKFKNSSWNTTNFKNRADFCEDYLSEE